MKIRHFFLTMVVSATVVVPHFDPEVRLPLTKQGAVEQNLPTVLKRHYHVKTVIVDDELSQDFIKKAKKAIALPDQYLEGMGRLVKTTDIRVMRLFMLANMETVHLVTNPRHLFLIGEVPVYPKDGSQRVLRYASLVSAYRKVMGSSPLVHQDLYPEVATNNVLWVDKVRLTRAAFMERFLLTEAGATNMLKTSPGQIGWPTAIVWMVALLSLLLLLLQPTRIDEQRKERSRIGCSSVSPQVTSERRNRCRRLTRKHPYYETLVEVGDLLVELPDDDEKQELRKARHALLARPECSNEEVEDLHGRVRERRSRYQAETLSVLDRAVELHLAKFSGGELATIRASITKLKTRREVRLSIVNHLRELVVTRVGLEG